MSWFSPAPTIDLLIPGIISYCNQFGVTVYWEDFVNLVFVFEGVEHRTDHKKFEVMADNDQFVLLNVYLKFICVSLRESYMGMDN